MPSFAKTSYAGLPGMTRTMSYHIPADALATDEFAYLGMGKFPDTGSYTIIGTYLLPEAALTAHDTNYKTITVSTCDSAAVVSEAIARWSTQTGTTGSKTGDWVAGTAISKAPTGATNIIPGGKYVMVATTKSGNGVALVGCTVVIQYTIDPQYTDTSQV